MIHLAVAADKAAHTVDIARQNSGGTWKVDFRLVQGRFAPLLLPLRATGFLVSLEAHEQWEVTLTAEQLVTYAAAKMRLLKLPTMCLGVWRSESGIWFYDVNKIVLKERAAKGIARSQNQIAIFDLALNKEVLVR